MYRRVTIVNSIVIYMKVIYIIVIYMKVIYIIVIYMKVAKNKSLKFYTHTHIHTRA